MKNLYNGNIRQNVFRGPAYIPKRGRDAWCPRDRCRAIWWCILRNSTYFSSFISITCYDKIIPKKRGFFKWGRGILSMILQFEPVVNPSAAALALASDAWLSFIQCSLNVNLKQGWILKKGLDKPTEKWYIISEVSTWMIRVLKLKKNRRRKEGTSWVKNPFMN